MVAAPQIYAHYIGHALAITEVFDEKYRHLYSTKRCSNNKLKAKKADDKFNSKFTKKYEKVLQSVVLSKIDI